MRNIKFVTLTIFLLVLLIPTSVIQTTAQIGANNWEHPAFDKTNTGLLFKLGLKTLSHEA